MDVRLEHEQSKRNGAAMPPAVRGAVLGGVGLILAGALYLISVRGDALLLDLSAFSQRIFCF